LGGHSLLHLPAREPAVSCDVLVSCRTGQAASHSCLIDKRFRSSGGSIQAVRSSSLALVRQYDSAVPNGEPRERCMTLRPELGAPAAPSGRISPNALLVRAWRSLIELRIDDASAAVAQFEQAIGAVGGPLAPRSREFAEVLRAVLVVLNSHDCAAL